MFFLLNQLHFFNLSTIPSPKVIINNGSCDRSPVWLLVNCWKTLLLDYVRSFWKPKNKSPLKDGKYDTSTFHGLSFCPIFPNFPSPTLAGLSHLTPQAGNQNDFQPHYYFWRTTINQWKLQRYSHPGGITTVQLVRNGRKLFPWKIFLNFARRLACCRIARLSQTIEENIKGN